MGDVYGLHHAKLNVDLPPTHMWMNLGYWDEQETRNNVSTARKFHDACVALLDKLLERSIYPLSDDPNSSADIRVRRKIKIVDLGVGCGDQTFHMLVQWHASMGFGKRGDLVFYTGLTDNRSQYEFAQQRLQLYHPNESFNINFVCTDAANPDSWSTELRDSITSAGEKQPDESTWVLALDSLYHFRPSRKPIISFAYKEAMASIVAFDLLLSDSTSWFQRLLLRLVCLLLQVPFSNFLTPDQYEASLVHVGYKVHDIDIEDISPKVFAPLANNLNARHVELKRYGFGGLGVYRIAQIIFSWFATSGVVRACIILAKR